MNHDVVTVTAVSFVKDIKTLLEGNKHNAYPVLNSKGEVIGLITRNFINIMIKNQAWFGESLTGLSMKSNQIKE
jgi:CBS-domain-containing membrane protein